MKILMQCTGGSADKGFFNSSSQGAKRKNCMKISPHRFKGSLGAFRRKLFKSAAGQAMVEYVMLIVLIALSVFMLTPNIKSSIITVFSNTSSALKTGSGS
jgi:Flp pilus assembly pilin Flp